MNALAEDPPRHRPPPAPAASITARPSGFRYTAGLLVALGIHAIILFAWSHPPVLTEQLEFGVEAAETSVEVSLVAAPPAEEQTAIVEPTSDLIPPPVEPEPPSVMEPPPLEPATVPAMTLLASSPTPPPPAPKRETARLAPAKTASKPKPAAPAVGDGSSALPGRDAITATASSGATSAKPGYLRNPHPAYPEAARAARQQGVVLLAVNVDAQGHVTGVRVARSSGFPLLDERARSTVSERWSFRPAKTGGVPVASDVSIPIRFTFER